MAASLRIFMVFFAVLWVRLSAQYTINTIAGGGPSDGTTALNVSLGNPFGVARDAAGNLYIVSRDGNRVYKRDSNGLLSVLAGNNETTHLPLDGGPPGRFSGDGGPAVSASLNGPMGVAVDATGNVYIADTGNYR